MQKSVPNLSDKHRFVFVFSRPPFEVEGNVMVGFRVTNFIIRGDDAKLKVFQDFVF